MTTDYVSLAELLDRKQSGPPSLRASIDFVGRVQERSGHTSSWSAMLGWENASPEAQAKLEKAFPTGPDGPHKMLDLMSDGHGADLAMRFSGSHIHVHLLRDHSETIADIARDIFLDAGIIKLERIWIRDTERGQGKGVRILLGTYEVAKRLGIKRMLLEALWGGSYVWARAGFVPDTNWEWERVRENIAEDLELHPFVTAEAAVKARIKEILADDDPKAIWKLVDCDAKFGGKKLTKQLMYNNAWEGEFNLNDAAAVKRLKAYAKSRSGG